MKPPAAAFTRTSALLMDPSESGGPIPKRSGSPPQLLRKRLRAPRGRHRIAYQDRPARTPPKTLALLAAAKRAGFEGADAPMHAQSEVLRGPLGEPALNEVEPGRA